MQKKWYQDWRSWITILLIFFVPTFIIGIIVMWSIAPWSKRAKWWVTGVGLGISLLGILATGLILLVNPTRQISTATDVKKRADVQVVSTGARSFCLEIGRCPNFITEIRDRGFIKEIPIDPDTKTYYLYELTNEGKDCVVKTTLSTKEEFSRPCISNSLKPLSE